MLVTPFIFRLHNWRKFETATITIPSTPLCIVDQNGSGKTSIIAAMYSLCTSKPWPGLTFKQLLRNNASYFGISKETDWYLNGSVSASGRIVTKYCNETDIQIAVMTYLPTDNQWFFMTRTQKLSILDTLLTQALGAEYAHALKHLQKAVQQKNALLKRYVETGVDDPLLAGEYSKQIHEFSTILWSLRSNYFETVMAQINQFYSWIESSETFEFKSQRTNGPYRQYMGLDVIPDMPEYVSLWNIEKQRQRLQYGAQRDDFEFYVGFNPIASILSRGEMRLFVLFLKYAALSLNPLSKEIVWLLDDIFNEFDQKREQILLESVLSGSSSFIATSTKIPSANVQVASLFELLD